jgi:spectinomycin phosphotransferase
MSREPPADLSEGVLQACLHGQFGLAVAALTFLPLGHDALAWVYRVETAGGTPYFLKVRRGLTNAPSLLVPRYLHDHGVDRVIAPLLTTTGRPWAEVAGYTLILYPFVAGATGMKGGMAPAQWIAYGAALRQIHETSVALDLAGQLRRETFVPYGVDLVRDLQARLAAGLPAGDPIARELAKFWAAHDDTIHALVARAESRGRALARTAPPFVLCHADIHTDNVLLDAAGDIWIVDWDETMLAPRERDVMFAVGGGISATLVGPAEEELFRRGYGDAPLDPHALAYYRHAWAVNDIGEYGLQVLARPDLGPLSRRAALETFISLFRPTEIVGLALGSPA